MKVFISWSGNRSQAVAAALHTWLKQVVQAVDPWMSKHDLEAGVKWGRELQGELEQTAIGVLCLTKENVDAPWLIFEAGALAGHLDDGTNRVIPFLIDMGLGDVPQGPLSQFQAAVASR